MAHQPLNGGSDMYSIDIVLSHAWFITKIIYFVVGCLEVAAGLALAAASRNVFTLTTMQPHHLHPR